MAPTSKKNRQQITAQNKEGKPFRFDLLPTELQLMVWEFAIVPNGVHHFRLEFPERQDDEDGDDEDYNQELEPQPVAPKAAGDPSSWRVRRILSQTCVASRQIVQALGPFQPFWSTPIPKQRRRSGPQKQREVCNILNSQDLLFFRPSGAFFETELLSLRKNRLRFQEVTRLALDIKPGGQKDWVMKPFECLCNPQAHQNLYHCPETLCDFLDIFENIKCFYFVLNLTKASLKPPESQDGKHPWEDKLAAQIIDEQLANFARIVNDAGLDSFSDNRKAYYEVRKADTECLKEHVRIWELIESLQTCWLNLVHLESNQTIRENFQRTQFKLLVCRARIWDISSEAEIQGDNKT